ncbi:hypothetical protein CDL15_Pgr003595 [Punica granatum]|uniref:Uncharacterized protein n=1 Tax=Punica granatum TaxID=22663 RepID=A0A218XTA4_PUNGR|nr:hypothetical protein CDL15_Pgr003595 [Punica granatum]
MRLLLVLYDDGQVMSCSVSKKGLEQADLIKPERIVGSGDAVCTSVASEQQILAVGTTKGVVELYDLAESASLIRTVSLHDWGGVSGMTYVRQVIYGEDRLLVVQSEDTNELKMLHLNLPVSYISQNWPVQHVAASKDIRFKKWRLFGDLSTVRELSIMTAKSHPAAMRFIPDQLPRVVISNNHLASSDFVAREPARCLILRVNGELSLLDLDDGRERDLTDSVELFWVTCGQSVEKTNLIEEVSWLDYGHREMQLSFDILAVYDFNHRKSLSVLE